MSFVHVCSLPQKNTSGLPKLAPNASLCKRLWRKFRKLIVLDPKNSKCNTFFFNKSLIMDEQKRHISSRYSYIIHPFSTLSNFLEIVFFALWTGRMISETVIGNMVVADSLAFRIIDCVVTIIQLIVVVTSFFVGYVDANTKKIVIDHKQVVKRYLKTFFVFDLVATEIPNLIHLVHVNMYVAKSETVSWYVHNVSHYIHVPCLYVRLNTVLRYLNEIEQMMKIGKNVRVVVGYALKTYMYLHFFGCMLYLIPQLVYLEDWPTDSWLVVAKIHPSEGAPFFKIYSECLLMAIVFFFGVSSGRFNANQTNEQICLIIITIFGRMYTLFLIADTLKIFGIPGLSKSNYERELIQMKEYMTSNDFSVTLRSKMIRYFEYKFQKRLFDEYEILSNLSDGLKTQIFLFLAGAVMQKSNVFKFIPQEEVSSMISLMKLKTFMPGDLIFKPGQCIENIFFISSGSIAIVNKDGLELCHMEDGDVFGLCTLVMGKESNSAVVLEATDIFIIKTDIFYQFLEAYPEAAKYIRRLAKERVAVYKQMEHAARNKENGCRADLRNGALLEKRRRRLD